MNFRKIASMINEEFKRLNFDINIIKNSINRYLKAELGKPRKILEVIQLTYKKKKEMV